MVEYWNVVFYGIFFQKYFLLLWRDAFPQMTLIHLPNTQYSIIPEFQYSFSV